METNNPKQLAAVNIYLLSENNNSQKIIAAIKSIEENTITWLWNDIPPSGTYKIYGEAVTWKNEKIKTNDITIIINNINQFN